MCSAHNRCSRSLGDSFSSNRSNFVMTCNEVPKKALMHLWNEWVAGDDRHLITSAHRSVNHRSGPNRPSTDGILRELGRTRYMLNECALCSLTVSDIPPFCQPRSFCAPLWQHCSLLPSTSQNHDNGNAGSVCRSAIYDFKSVEFSCCSVRCYCICASLKSDLEPMRIRSFVWVKT